MNEATPFPISVYDYYGNNDDYSLIHLLSLNYIGSKAYKENAKKDNSNQSVYIELQDVLLTHDFIKWFYDYDKPVRDYDNDNIIWIYPKLEIKEFLTNYLFDTDNRNYYYYEESTLNKLLLIMYGFVRYEYDNIDSNMINQIEQLNFPTLILANIYLYEKGILKISDEEKGIGIMLDLNGEKTKDVLFTNNEHKLKKSIIRLLNATGNSNYTLKDFM